MNYYKLSFYFLLKSTLKMHFIRSLERTWTSNPFAWRSLIIRSRTRKLCMSSFFKLLYFLCWCHYIVERCRTIVLLARRSRAECPINWASLITKWGKQYWAIWLIDQPFHHSSFIFLVRLNTFHSPHVRFWD